MSWTEERIETLKTMWEAGETASQIAEALGGVSRNAVIGKAHRLGLQARPSPVVPKDSNKDAAKGSEVVPAPTPAPVPESEPTVSVPPPPPEPEPVQAVPVAAEPIDATVEDRERTIENEDDDEGDDGGDDGSEKGGDGDDDEVIAPVVAAPRPPQPILRSVGPGGFLRQAPGEQQAPITPAPPRRLVPSRPSAEIAGKTSLLDLSDKICKWPLGHPGEPDFHFCGEKVNPGFPYCVAHCGHAYQAQLPRRDRRAPPLPFGGPRAR